MSLSCPSHTSLTETELSMKFGNGTTQIGLLPETMPSSLEREQNGMLKSATVTEIVNNLKRIGIIPTATPTNTDEYKNKQAKLVNDIKSEYCFYYARYKYSLEKLLNFIRQGYNSNMPVVDSTIQTSIQKYLASTQELNQKLNDLIQITNGIISQLTSSTAESDIINFEKELKEQQDKLINQSKVIKSTEAAAKLNKEMVKYTEEKAKYTDNLLNMYTVLNIFALGMLLYIYKSAND